MLSVTGEAPKHGSVRGGPTPSPPARGILGMRGSRYARIFPTPAVAIGSAALFREREPKFWKVVALAYARTR